MSEEDELNLRLAKLMARGEFAEAEAAFLRAIHAGGPAYLYHGLANAQSSQGKLDAADETYRTAMELWPPRTADGWAGYANFLPTLGRFDEAEAAYREALKINPDHPPSLGGLGLILTLRGALSEAEAVLTQAMHLNLDLPSAITLCNGLSAQGRPEDAIDFYNKLPPPAWANPAFLDAVFWPYLYSERASREDLGKVLDLYSRSLPPQTPARHFPNDRNPDRKLRLGLMSGDFRRHSVYFFLRPLLENLDPDEVEVTAYHTGSAVDEATEDLKGLTKRWRHVNTTPIPELVGMAKSDKIDVMVDLSGHTQGNRLIAFALRMAPVQVSWLGYPATTAVPAMDYRLVDTITDPMDVSGQTTEKLIRIDPTFLCYRPAPEMPAPSQSETQPTFGTFNDLGKARETIVNLWVDILNENPGSKFLMKAGGFRDEKVRQVWKAKFMRFGLGSNRVELLPTTPGVVEHLETYNRLTVAVDSYPYNGTTTTAEALAMGVPVVTLTGASHLSRVSTSMLHALGEDGWACRNPDEYKATVSRLLARPRTTEDRLNLRGQLLRSPLCEGAAFAERWTEAIRDCWRSWCSG